LPFDAAAPATPGLPSRDLHGCITSWKRCALPRAAFIGFTGTPIEFPDKNTQAVLGEYIRVYEIQRAVEDKATVPI
jgi:type I restriction enzyme R subunit